LGKADAKYIRRDNGDIKRLRQSLGAAWRHSKAGLTWQQDGMSNAEFAAVLSDVGIPCTRADVENAARKLFAPKKCPPTPAVFQALERLAERLPSLDPSVFIASANGSIDLLSTIGAHCPFVARLHG
jgi:FMN phosphatase YigB (HAD superfamily)